MGHLPIVNQTTVKDVIESGFISTRGDLKQMWEKTTADIFSDMLATRKGDYVFPWIIAGDGERNIGFKYIFCVAGPPIFVKGDEYPVKVPLSTEGLEYSNPLPEAAALDLWDPELLWNAIGKKSLRRGRSLTHQTPMEDDRLTYLLNSLNPGGPKNIKLGKVKYTSTPLTIDATKDEWDPELLSKLKQLPDRNRLSELELSGIPWRTGNLFYVEKTLEAWIMENLDKPAGKEFREKILDPNLKIEWFGNYLPFGVAGSNIDVVVVQPDSPRKLATIIELKVAALRLDGFISAAKQVRMYGEFIKNAYKAYGEDIEARGLVISGPSRIHTAETSDFKDLGIDWFTYYIDKSGDVHFHRLLPRAD